VLIAISNIMKRVINDEKIDMISKFYNLDAQMLLSEANIFTMLHAMQTWSSDENSVCLFVKRVHCDKTEKKIGPDFYTIRKNILTSFLTRRMGWWGNPFYLKFWVKLTALE